MIVDNVNPNYRIHTDFLSKEELELILKDITSQPEEYWNHEFDTNYPKKEDVSEEAWIGMVGWRGMIIVLSEKEKDMMDLYGLNLDFYNTIAEKAKKQIEDRFDVKVKVEQFLLNRWRVGREQLAHIDYYLEDENNNSEYEEKYGTNNPHFEDFKKKFQTKHFSTIIYLNDDFSGGELYFPQHDVEDIKPETNMAIFFKGDTHHMHGVKKVEEGIRYTISLFWTEE